MFNPNIIAQLSLLLCGKKTPRSAIRWMVTFGLLSSILGTCVFMGKWPSKNVQDAFCSFSECGNISLEKQRCIQNNLDIENPLFIVKSSVIPLISNSTKKAISIKLGLKGHIEWGDRFLKRMASFIYIRRRCRLKCRTRKCSLVQSFSKKGSINVNYSKT